jgi:phenylpropionate dioxygenase-like ring-hydroxylating dioxygenase large terminal subunit
MTDQWDILTQTGPGTPMGRFMRQYWIPAALSSELAADGPPVRLMLLGERLVAFRDSAGRVGILDHRCPHRGASLFYGRNEENGLRCVYHGWKYDADGRCLDMANVPPQQSFKDKVCAKAYLAAERSGLVWVFMGERERAPGLPPFESALLPQDEIEYRFVQRRCNWLQAIEGDLDTSHLGFLHFGGARLNAGLDAESRNLVVNRAPEYKVADTPFGMSYGAYRPAEGGGAYWRTAHMLFPFWVMPPIAKIEANVMVRGWIPLDDEHCMFVGIAHKDYLAENRGRWPMAGASLIDTLHPNGTGWLDRFRMVEAEENEYFIDRAAQKAASFTGVEGIHVQDQMITESMGPNVDRALENLAPSDIAVVRGRRCLMRALAAFEAGQRPPGADDPTHYAGVRGGYYTTPETGDWLDVMRARVAASPHGAAAAAQ